MELNQLVFSSHCFCYLLCKVCFTCTRGSSKNHRDAALNLSDYVQANAGYALPIVSDKTAATEYEILIGATNRSESKESVTLGADQYALFTKNNKIVCLGNSYMVGGGAGAFAQMITTDKSQAEIKIDNLPTTPKAETFKTKKAKSAVLMIGDGMGFNTVSMAEQALGYSFAPEILPNLGSCVTASVNTQNNPEDPTDSAASATALATGFKTKDKYLGVNQNKSTVKNIRELANEKGANTGVITTDVITGATPGGFLVHHSNRSDTEEIQSKIDALKNALNGEDINLIKNEKEALTQAFYKISEKLYQQAQAAGAQPGGFNPEDFAGAQGGYADPNAGDGYADAGYTDANFTDAN